MAQIPLQQVPQTIRDWFGSEDTIDFLIDLNEKLRIDLDSDSARIIPHLLYRLETKDVDPLHFSEQVAYWLQIPKEQADSIVSEIKEKILNPIREDLNKFGLNISLIDVTHAKPFLDALPQIHVNPRPPAAEYLARKAALQQQPEAAPQAVKDKLTLVEERLKKEMEQNRSETTNHPNLRMPETEKRGPTIKINRTLLGLQDKPLRNYESSESANTSQPQAEDKPFVLFGEEPRAAAPARPAGKGFSVPFGFFNKNRSETTNHPNLQTQQRPDGILGAIKKPAGKAVDYSAERAAITPFAKEEDVFRIKDQGPRIKDQGLKIKENDETKTPLEKMFQEQETKNKKQETSSNGGAAPKPNVEAPPADGSVPIKTSPFSFPKKSNDAGNGKPKIEGNMVHL